jgi:hypothetical protein
MTPSAAGAGLSTRELQGLRRGKGALIGATDWASHMEWLLDVHKLSESGYRALLSTDPGRARELACDYLTALIAKSPKLSSSTASKARTAAGHQFAFDGPYHGLEDPFASPAASAVFEGAGKKRAQAGLSYTPGLLTEEQARAMMVGLNSIAGQCMGLQMLPPLSFTSLSLTPQTSPSSLHTPLQCLLSTSAAMMRRGRASLPGALWRCVCTLGAGP